MVKVPRSAYRVRRMNILAFDTCFDACSVCVAELRDGLVSLSSRMERFETGHAERLIPMIGEAMDEAGLPFEKLDRIAVTIGPGTFTGTRIGIAAARSLALATNAQTAGVSSLAVMADVARRDITADTLAVVTDARRGEVYAQLFGPAGGYAPLSPPLLLAVDDAVRRVLRALKDTGRMRSTLVVFTSDNGAMYGEHRLFGKKVPYEESIRVPLLVRGAPHAAAEARRSDEAVSLLDLPAMALAWSEGRAWTCPRDRAEISMPSVVPVAQQCDVAWRGWRSATEKQIWKADGARWWLWE